MTEQQSFTKLEHELVPQLRRDMNFAESVEDIRKFFTYNARHLLFQAMAGDVQLNPEDIQLNPHEPPYYRLGPAVTGNERFQAVWQQSDLANILERFAETAANHYQRLLKGPDKTEAKMYPSPGEQR